MKFFWYLFLMLSMIVLPANGEAQVVDGKNLVEPSLHVGVNDLTKPFTIAIRFKIAPEWHLYWKNPGDAGLAPKAIWHLPDGFTVGELQFPTPHKIASIAAVDFGYDEELTLLATITPPKNAPKPKMLKVDLTWLVCRESCIPGDASLSLDLSSLTANERNFANKLIAETQTRHPFPLSKLNASLKSALITKQGEKSSLEIQFMGTDAEKITDFFPEEIPHFVVNYTDIKVNKGVISFPLLPTTKDAKVSEVRGLVLIGNLGYTFYAPLIDTATTPEGLLTQTFNQNDESVLSLWLALFFAFIGGLILNVMPCVLPVISLKVMSFIDVHSSIHGNSKKGFSKTLQHGLLFALGVLLSFWVLALAVILLQQAGEQIGWGFQFQSPMFVMVMAAIMFVFGLNLIGVFEFAAPPVTGEISNTLSRRDALGSLANGVLATTLATPCTAPFLGSALGFAFSQPAYVIFSIFTVVALGLATPYLVLAAKPEWLKFIPKPGEWMVRFKQAMGFFLFATVVWLLSVIGSQLGAQGIIATLTLLLAIAIACWGIGSFINFNSTLAHKLGVWSVSVLFLISVYLFIFEGFLNLNRARTPPNITIDRYEGGINWKPFSIALVEESVLSGKPVFIDFTADWCFTCKVTEQTVIETDPVREKINSIGVVTLKADWTNRDDTITQLLKKFGRSGVPLYVVFPAGKLNEPIILPEVITQDMLINALEKSSSSISLRK